MTRTPPPTLPPPARPVSRVAATWTKLLPRAALARKLHQAVRHARLSLAKAKT